MPKMIKISHAVRYLSYCIGFIGFIAVSADISLYYSIPFAVLAVISIYRDATQSFTVPRWLLNTLALIVISFAIVQLTIDNLLQTSVQSLIVVLVVKFLEDKKFRDYMQIYGITVFLLCGYALMHIDISFLIYFFILIFLITASIVLLTYHSEDSEAEMSLNIVRKIIWKSSFITLLAIPTAAVMFVILPRTKYPILKFLNRSQIGIVGFTDKVELGAVSTIQEDNSVLLRVEMKKIDSKNLYWRAVTLDHFDGKSWSDSGITKQIMPFRIKNIPEIVHQTIYLEPYENRYLFALDIPLKVDYPNAKSYNDFTFMVKDPVLKRVRYDAVSVLADFMPADLDNIRHYLQLPKKSFEDERQFALQTISGKEGIDAVNAIAERLRSSEFRYSLSAIPQSTDPIKDFLLHHKTGNCEYFASAMAVILRLQGIPSRIVGGFKGGDYIDAAGYYVVPQRYAHVWVEAFIEGKGWMRFDPTPGSTSTSSSLDTLTKIRLYLDIISYYWNAVVINYDMQRQFKLFSSLTYNIKKPTELISFAKKYLLPIIAALAMIFLLFLLTKKLAFAIQRPDEIILKKFLKSMSAKGYIKSHSEGLHEFALKIKESELQRQALLFINAFEQYYYKDKAFTPHICKELKKLIP